MLGDKIKMKKNGFTLIELIVCVTLLVLITGIITSLVIKENNSKKNLENITKEVLEAVNIFLETEKDEKGNTYNKGINSGGKALRIPLDTLTDKGYVNKTKSEEIKKLAKLSNDSDYYILIADGDYNIESLNNETDYCKNNAQLIIASWTIDETKKKDPIYLCDYEIKPSQNINSGENLKKELLSVYNETELNAINQKVYRHITTDDNGLYDAESIMVENEKNGLFYRYVNDIKTYFYTGNVEDNYLKVYGDIYRIISFTDDELILILENPVAINTFYDENVIAHIMTGINYKFCENVSDSGWKACKKQLDNLNDFYALLNSRINTDRYTNLEAYINMIGYKKLCDDTAKDKPFNDIQSYSQSAYCNCEDINKNTIYVEKLRDLICPFVDIDYEISTNITNTTPKHTTSNNYIYNILSNNFFGLGNNWDLTITQKLHKDISFMSGSEKKEWARLLTYEEAKYAGLSLDIKFNIKGFHENIITDSYCHDNNYYYFNNNSYLSNGGNTIIMSSDSDVPKYYSLKNVTKTSKMDYEGDYKCEVFGYFQEISIPFLINYSYFENENIYDVRPVIHVPFEKISEFKGKGTKKVPYEIS